MHAFLTLSIAGGFCAARPPPRRPGARITYIAGPASAHGRAHIPFKSRLRGALLAARAFEGRGRPRCAPIIRRLIFEGRPGAFAEIGRRASGVVCCGTWRRRQWRRRWQRRQGLCMVSGRKCTWREAGMRFQIYSFS